MTVSLKCRCGALRGHLTDLSLSRGFRIVCLCDDCQTYAHYLGGARDVLDANGGTDILPVVPASVKLTHGVENLRCLRLSPKGVLRWYAGCCKTPIANTSSSARLPYAGIVHLMMDHAADGTSHEKALGPVRARIFGKFGIGELPAGTLEKGSPGLLLRVLLFMARGWLGRLNRPSPFFNSETGEPVVQPYVLTKAERQAFRRLCGPKPLPSAPT